MSITFTRLPVHRPPVGIASMAPHPAGRRLAVVRSNASIEMWEYDEQGDLVLTQASGGLGGVTPRGVAWHNATTLLLATLSGQFLVFDAASLTLKDVVTGAGGGGFLAMAKGSSVDDAVATASEDGCVRLYRGPSLAIAGTGMKHPSSTMALSVCMSPGGTHLYCGDNAGCVQQFLVANMSPTSVTAPVFSCVLRITLKAKKGQGFDTPLVWSLCVATATPHLFAGTSTGDVFVINTANGTQAAAFHVAKAPLTCVVALGPSTVCVAGVSRDIISLQHSAAGWGVGARTRRIHCNDVTSMVSPLPHKLITGGLDGDLFMSSGEQQVRGMFSAAVSDMKDRLRKYQGYVHPASGYSPATWADGTSTLFGVGRHAVCAWAMDGGATLAEIGTKGMRDSVRTVCVSRDGAFLALSTDTAVSVLSLEGSTSTAVCVTSHDIVTRDAKFRDSVAEASAMCFASAKGVGWILFVGSASGEVRAVAMTTGNTDTVVSCPCAIVRMVSQRDTVAILDASGGLTLWSVATWKVTAARSENKSRVIDVCFCGDNDVNIATLTSDGHVTVMTLSAEVLWTTVGNIPNFPPLRTRFLAMASVKPSSIVVYGPDYVCVMDTSLTYANTDVTRFRRSRNDDAASSPDTLHVLRVQRAVAVVPSSTAKGGITVLCRHPSEEFSGMTVFDAKRYGT